MLILGTRQLGSGLSLTHQRPCKAFPFLTFVQLILQLSYHHLRKEQKHPDLRKSLA